MSFVIGVDSSTTATKAVVWNREGRAVADGRGRAVRPAIVWMDVRATRQVERFGSDDVHRLTGKPADTTPALYKLLWLCEHEPNTMERTRWVVDVHAFLVHRLTGTWRTTTACADPLGLIDMDRRDWSDDLLARVELSRDRVPTLSAPGDLIGELSVAASQ